MKKLILLILGLLVSMAVWAEDYEVFEIREKGANENSTFLKSLAAADVLRYVTAVKFEKTGDKLEIESDGNYKNIFSFNGNAELAGSWENIEVYKYTVTAPDYSSRPKPSKTITVSFTIKELQSSTGIYKNHPFLYGISKATKKVKNNLGYAWVLSSKFSGGKFKMKIALYN